MTHSRGRGDKPRAPQIKRKSKAPTPDLRPARLAIERNLDAAGLASATGSAAASVAASATAARPGALVAFYEFARAIFAD